MRTMKGGWIVLCLTGMVGGPVLAQTRSVDVQISPIHTVPDAGAVSDASSDWTLEDGRSRPQMSAAVQSDRAAPAVRPARWAPAAAASEPSPAGPRGASVPVSRRIVEAAGAFERYMVRAHAISAQFSDGAEVARAVRLGGSYEPRQFQEGLIALSALTALQQPGFVEGVSGLADSPAARADLIRGLQAQPETALSLPGAREAGALIVTVVGRLGGDLVQSGAAVKQAAYDVQHQAWSKQSVTDGEAELAQIKAVSRVRAELTPAEAAGLISDLPNFNRRGVAEEARGAAPTPVVARGLAIAALAVLGAAGEDQGRVLDGLLSEGASAECLKMAKLNLYQCLAVADPHYEHMFCLGRHAMMDTGQCVVRSVSGSGAAAVPVTPARSILVPTALSAYGPEQSAAMSRDPAVPASSGAGALEERMFFSTPVRPNGPLPSDRFVGGPLASDADDRSSGGYGPEGGRALNYGPVS